MRDVDQLIDALDRVVVTAPGFVDEGLAIAADSAALQLRRRTGYLGETLVLAIVGGTGAGKSSLLNAIAGEPIASVSDIRPHTHEPLAWIPESAGGGLTALLDDLEVHVRRPQNLFDSLCIIDLPDFDSYAEAHREVVERLLPLVDVVAWLVDPVKYADPSLHSDFLKPVHQHGAQFVFVMNKMDLLSPESRVLVVDDFVRLLAEDGFEESSVIVIAASPTEGEPFGIDELTAHLHLRLTDKRLALNKLVHEVRDLVRRIGIDASVWNGFGESFDERWRVTRDKVATGLAEPDGSPEREDAACRLSDFVAAFAQSAGDHAAEVRKAVPHTVIDQAIKDVAANAMTTSLTARKDHLDAKIGSPLRDWAHRRAVFGATVAFAGVSAYAVEDRLWR